MTSNQDHDESSQPSEFLVENIELLVRGRVLDVAMGSGRNAVYLARAGFEVEGVDISAEAVDSARQLAQENNAVILAEVGDLETNFSIPADSYDDIVCFNYLQRSLIPQIKAGLKTNGIVVYETFIVDQAQFGRPRNPDFLLKHNELLEMFRDFRCLRYREGIFANRKAVAGIVAQKS
jgi:SAM-dependent methyltransferase